MNAFLSFLSITATLASVTIADIYTAKSDYIIIGAGPAGLVLAEQLSRNPSKHVTILEAGLDAINSTLVNTPAFYIQLSEPFWNYTVQPDPNLNGATPSLGQARILGGGSAVNGMAYCRGSASLFDEWAELSGNPGLAWESLLEDFVEVSHLGDQVADYDQFINKTVYGNGPLEVSRSSGLTGFEIPFVNAIKSNLGLDVVDLTDGTGIGIDMGVGTIRANSRTRSHAGNSFGTLLDGRPNVRVITGAWASRIGFKRNVAVNVTYHTDSGKHTIQGKEIVVSGGAINTPKLLMLSGIGPKQKLKALGIPVIADMKDIGANLRDHAFAIAELLVTPEVLTTWQWSVNATGKVAAEIQYAVNGSGPLGWNNGFVFAGFRLPASVWEGIDGSHFTTLPADRPHILIEFSTAPFLPTNNASSIVAWASLVQPESSGYVTLNSSDYRADPLIHTNYYGSDADKAAIIAGYKILLDVLSGQEVQQLTIDRFYPASATPLDSDDDVWAAVQQQTYSFHHPIGTAALGKVLDRDWRLRGLQGIRVVDSSTFPYPTTCHPQAVIYALANRAAKDIIASDWSD